jgi:chemotaxis regulatin CheY-phosphate phosphatase CheZ
LLADARRLRADFGHMRRALEDYRRCLAETNGGAEWHARAVDGLRDQHLALLEARVSLGSVELACALLRHVLRRLDVGELRFLPHREEPSSAPEAAPQHSGSPPDGPPEALAALLAVLRSAMHTAPLELQERLLRVLVAVEDFLAALAADTAEGIRAAIARVNLAASSAQSRGLLREVAIVTRDAHNALRSVSEALPLEQLTQSSGSLPQAVERLNSVVARLDDAAGQNLDLLESLNRVGAEESARLDTVLETLRAAQQRLMALKSEHPDLAPALARIQDRLGDEVGAPVMTLRHLLECATDEHLELISDQSFQELTGRTLRKIIEFVQALDAQLYRILQPYGGPGVDRKPPPDSPQSSPHAMGPTGNAQSQEDVDKLLGELGF